MEGRSSAPAGAELKDGKVGQGPQRYPIGYAEE